MICENAAELTCDKVFRARYSRNMSLVRSLLLDSQADIHSTRSLAIPPLATALRLDVPCLRKILEDSGTMSKMKDQAHFLPTTRDASEDGNKQSIEAVMRLGEDFRPEDLGYAHTVVAKDGKDAIVRMLLDAGPNPNLDSGSVPRYGAPLREALKRCKESLISMLLDAGANVNYSAERGGKFNGEKHLCNLLLNGVIYL